MITVLYSFGALALRFVLGDAAPAGDVASGLPATVLLNLLLTLPVYALVRRLLPPRELSDRDPRGAAAWLTARRGSRGASSRPTPASRSRTC